jgi:hypothetical protein
MSLEISAEPEPQPEQFPNWRVRRYHRQAQGPAGFCGYTFRESGLDLEGISFVSSIRILFRSQLTAIQRAAIRLICGCRQSHSYTCWAYANVVAFISQQSPGGYRGYIRRGLTTLGVSLAGAGTLFSVL